MLLYLAVAEIVPRQDDTRWEKCQESFLILPSSLLIIQGLKNRRRLSKDIITGIKKTDGKYIDICDRKEAIRYAIEHGQKGDVIILAGKGHETYQEIKGVKYDMDDRVLIQEVLDELKE